MKLLPKSELAQAIALDRRLEIEQGISLARRVDKLRETSSTEEANLSKFKNNTLSIVKSEINSLIEDRDKILVEVEKLREEKDLSSAFLEEEWTRFREKESELTLKEESLSRELFAVSDLRESLASEIAQVELEKNKLIEGNNNIIRLHDNLKELERHHQYILEENKREVEKNSNDFNERSRELLRKEEDVKARENAVEQALKDISMKERELINQRILLIDREQTLEREIIRQKK